MMKPVLQTTAEGMDPVLRQLAADPVAERTVERREDRFRILKGKGQQVAGKIEEEGGKIQERLEKNQERNK